MIKFKEFLNEGYKLKVSKISDVRVMSIIEDQSVAASWTPVYVEKSSTSDYGSEILQELAGISKDIDTIGTVELQSWNFRPKITSDLKLIDTIGLIASLLDNEGKASELKIYERKSTKTHMLVQDDDQFFFLDQDSAEVEAVLIIRDAVSSDYRKGDFLRTDEAGKLASKEIQKMIKNTDFIDYSDKEKK